MLRIPNVGGILGILQVKTLVWIQIQQMKVHHYMKVVKWVCRMKVVLGPTILFRKKLITADKKMKDPCIFSPKSLEAIMLLTHQLTERHGVVFHSKLLQISVFLKNKVLVHH